MNCITCNKPITKAERCTNERCGICHGYRCSAGGDTTPGHGHRGGLTVEEEARQITNRRRMAALEEK